MKEAGVGPIFKKRFVEVVPSPPLKPNECTNDETANGCCDKIVEFGDIF